MCRRISSNIVTIVRLLSRLGDCWSGANVCGRGRSWPGLATCQGGCVGGKDKTFALRLLCTQSANADTDADADVDADAETKLDLRSLFTARVHLRSKSNKEREKLTA